METSGHILSMNKYFHMSTESVGKRHHVGTESVLFVVQVLVTNHI